MSSTKSEASKASFEDVIARDGELFFTNEGCSMLPLIHPKQDILHIKKIDKELEVGDIVLYSDRPHHYVLHRIIRIKGDGSFICAGDNNHWKDRPIKKELIIGRLKDITHPDGKTIDLDQDPNEARRMAKSHWKRAIALRINRLLRKR
ncbi:MAG: hypothetical protein J6328_02355 [Bacilli bacterium]|nr:hypothetical protein [Bacilli bacterium]